MGWYERLRGEEIMGDEPGEGYRRKTGAIDTRTSRPIYGESANEEPASFWTNYKAGWMDDPDTKIGIYAKARGIPEKEVEDRYAVVDGEVVFVGEGGQLHRERPVGVGTGLKGELAEQAAHAPEMIGSVLGAISPHPILGSAAGGAGGELVRKIGGTVMFDEPWDTREVLADTGKAGAFNAFGTGVGKWGARLRNWFMARPAGKIATAAGRERGSLAQNMGEIDRMTDLAREHGIDPLPPITTGSWRLRNKWELLRGQDETADQIMGAQQKISAQVEDAVYNFLDRIAPQSDAYGTGERLVGAGKKAIQDVVGAAEERVAPKYAAARAEAEMNAPISERVSSSLPQQTGIDVSQVVDKLTDLMKSATTGEKKYLKNIKNDLFREISTPSGPKQVLKNDFTSLDKVKKVIDGYIEENLDADAELSSPVRNYAKNMLTDVKDTLIAAIEKASPKKYPEARADWAGEMPGIKKAKGSIVGEISRLDGDKFTTAARRLFANVSARPETIAAARDMISSSGPDGPEIWDSSLRLFLQDEFGRVRNDIAREVEGTAIKKLAPNLGWNYAVRVFSTPEKQKILQAAMSPDQFSAFTNFMDLMAATGRVFGKEAATASKIRSIEKTERELGSSAARMLQRPWANALQIFDRMIYEGHMGKLADAFLSEDAADQLRRLKQLSPIGKVRYRAFGAWMGAVANGYFSNDPNDKKLSNATIQEMMRNGVSEQEIIRELGRRYYNEKQAKDLIGIARE